MKNILIIDDEDKLRSLLSRIIALEGFEVSQAIDCKSALRLLKNNNFQVIICDVKLPDGNGVEFVKEIKQQKPSSEIIMLTAYGSISDGVQAIKNGAFDYITKGDDNNKIIPTLHRAIEKIQLTNRVHQLEHQLSEKLDTFDTIIGNSKSFNHSVHLAKQVAPTDSIVLLTGETGTGKEVFAQSIHRESHRKDQPFIAINCATFGKNLLESELFGHEKGAFTGATKNKIGLLDEANEGTLFLDEIGEMDIVLQAKLLRVIETGEFMRVGDTKLKRVNVRIIAATNRDLQQEINENRFREDLYYRIAVFTITLPPLRERSSDIELLSKNFLQVFSNRMGRPIKNIDSRAMKVLKKHNWKGNIRELKNIIERAVILCREDQITLKHIPIELLNPSDEKDFISSFELAHAEKIHIQKTLQYTGGNKTKTAQLLNIALTTLYRKISEYDIQL